MLAQQEGRPEWGEGPEARPCRALALVLWWERERVRALEHVAAWQRSRAVAGGVGEQVERPGAPAGVSLRCLGMGGGQGSLLQWQRRTLGSRRSHGSWLPPGRAERHANRRWNLAAFRAAPPFMR